MKIRSKIINKLLKKILRIKSPNKETLKWSEKNGLIFTERGIN